MLFDQHFHPSPYCTWLLSISPLCLVHYASSRLRLHPLEAMTPAQKEKIYKISVSALFNPKHLKSARRPQPAAPTPPEWMLFSDKDGIRSFILHTITPVFLSAMDPQNFSIQPPIADIPAMSASDQARWLPAAFDAATLLFQRSINTFPEVLAALDELDKAPK